MSSSGPISSGSISSGKEVPHPLGSAPAAGPWAGAWPGLSGHARRMGRAALQVPHTLRALVRTDEIWLVALAAGLGLAAGLLVFAMNQTTLLMHRFLFLLRPGERLSGATDVDRLRCLLVPATGGLLLGLIGWALARWWPRKGVDPIEANALYGGRMSLADSLVLVAQTMLSNGVGGSVGLEAGYTQIGAAVASRLGQAFRVRRNDLRVLVGCGAAGAIAAAFNAPLTGAFYAFELVIGTYSFITLAPVATAAVCAVSVARVLGHEPGGFDIRVPGAIGAADYAPILVLAVLCALGGIALMRGVTLTEDLFRRSRVPGWLRAGAGGLLLGGCALVTPQVLSSGHAALRVGLDAPYPLAMVAMLLVLKATASAVSIGSGFRGGLFFASLFLGALVGKLFAGLFAMLTTAVVLPTVVCAVVGMCALAVAVVGGPLTMAFLALESTGSLPMTAAVLTAAVVSSLTVRRTFGYSFATWRFHLRGEAIRSAVDVGWMRSLTVGRMMQREFRAVRADVTPASFRREFALGSIDRVVALDDRERYAGLVLVPEAHARPEATLPELLHHQKVLLLPQMTIKEAVAKFESAESDALAVVENAESRKVIGVLTEQYALRRYSEELDRRRRELSGE